MPDWAGWLPAVERWRRAAARVAEVEYGDGGHRYQQHAAC